MSTTASAELANVPWHRGSPESVWGPLLTQRCGNYFFGWVLRSLSKWWKSLLNVGGVGALRGAAVW